MAAAVLDDAVTCQDAIIQLVARHPRREKEQGVRRDLGDGGLRSVAADRCPTVDDRPCAEGSGHPVPPRAANHGMSRTWRQTLEPSPYPSELTARHSPSIATDIAHSKCPVPPALRRYQRRRPGFGAPAARAAVGSHGRDAVAVSARWCRLQARATELMGPCSRCHAGSCGAAFSRPELRSIMSGAAGRCGGDRGGRIRGGRYGGGESPSTVGRPARRGDEGG